MRVYQVRRCPFAHRARIVLEEKKLPYDVEYFERGKRPAVLEGVSPDAKSPTLFDRAANKWVWGSLEVCEYLDEHYPQVPLMPREADALERARATLKEVEASLAPGLGPIEMEVVHKPPEARDEAKVREAIARLREALALWDARLGSQPYLLGEAFTLVDVALFTPLYSMPGVLGEEGEIPAALRPLRAWRERIGARPSTAY